MLPHSTWDQAFRTENALKFSSIGPMTPVTR